jgi:F1F0 ATPase subunit 2
MSDVVVLARAAAPVWAYALAALEGAALGALFFGGLWWTARRGAVSASPAWWFCGSLVLRLGIVLPGFYAVADGQWQRMLLCLLGFLAARGAVTRATRTTASVGRAPRGPRHAP